MIALLAALVRTVLTYALHHVLVVAALVLAGLLLRRVVGVWWQAINGKGAR